MIDLAASCLAIFYYRRQIHLHAAARDVQYSESVDFAAAAAAPALCVFAIRSFLGCCAFFFYIRVVHATARRVSSDSGVAVLRIWRYEGCRRYQGDLRGAALDHNGRRPSNRFFRYCILAGRQWTVTTGMLVLCCSMHRCLVAFSFINVHSSAALNFMLNFYCREGSAYTRVLWAFFAQGCTYFRLSRCSCYLWLGKRRMS